MKKTILTVAGWIISIALIVTLVIRLDWHAIAAGLSHAKWSFLIAAAILNIAVATLRALRWQWIMNSAQDVGFGAIFNATMISFAGNNLMPARGGDWLRIYLLGKKEGASKTMLASITGVDKLFDAFCILILFGALSFHSTFPDWVQRGTLIISIFTAVSLAICVMLLMHHRRSTEIETEKPGRFSRIASSLGSGMEILAQRGRIAATIALSIALCLMQIATIWLCQLAFGYHLDIWIPAIIYVAINLAIVIPSAPSGVGPFEAAAVIAYTWLGLKAESAFNIALAYHAIQFIPITAIGAVLYLRTISTANKPHMQHTARGS